MTDVEIRKTKTDLRALEAIVKNQKTEISLLFKNKR
jgi:gas vesicle protein